MKITIDVKSLLIGLAVASVAFFAMGTKSQADPENGKFKTEMRDNVVIILNTQNGDFIVATDLLDIKLNRWKKGAFYQIFDMQKEAKRR